MGSRPFGLPPQGFATPPNRWSSFAQFPKRRGATGGGTPCGARSPLTAGPLLGGAGAYLGPCTWRGALGGGAQHLGGAPLCIWRKTENCWKLLENCTSDEG